MAEYRRFISYIYAYEGDMKTKNVGFAKIEARSGQCRISISIKGAYECSGQELDLYGYGCVSGGFLLVPIGKIPVRGGVGEAVFGKKEDDLGGTGLGLDFIRGLYLRSGISARKAYLTTWDDTIIHISALKQAPEAGKDGFSAGQLMLKAAQVAEPETETGAAAETEAEAEAEPETETGAEPEAETGAEAEAELAAEAESEPAAVFAGTPSEDAFLESAEAAAAAEAPVLEEHERAPDREAEYGSGEKVPDTPEWKGRMPDQFYYREGFMELPLWDSLKKIFPRKPVLAEGGWEVLQIHLQDIGRLPRENWTYGNNSFVLHGYYQYRYLILARRYRERREKFQSEYQYILGVPGIFKPQEKFMASMFGLPDFKRAVGRREENFGFWCGLVKL